MNGAPFPQQQIRPLGALSDFVCDALGTQNALIRDGSVSAERLFDIAHHLLATLPDTLFTELLQDSHRTRRRVAILDFVWMIRSLDVAYTDDPDYQVKKRSSFLLQRTKALTDKEGRHPNLSWSDIAIYHPVSDPRSFLAPGEARDQEIGMYRSQSAIEKILKFMIDVHEKEKLSLDILAFLVDALKFVVKTMVQLNRERSPGHFYTLDPFLGPNNEHIGHATGAFSAWAYLVGYFLSGHEDFKQRLLRPQNRKAFDRDADGYIENIERGYFRTSGQLVRVSALNHQQQKQAYELLSAARDQFALFLRAHRGTIKKHARASFDVVSPANLSITNRQSIEKGIADMHDGKSV